MAIDWKRIKRDYGAKKFTLTELAKKYLCHPDTIRKKARKDGWDSSKSSAARPGSVIHDHRRMWGSVKKNLDTVLKKTDVESGVEGLKFAKLAGDALSSVVKGERQAWGLVETGADIEPEEMTDTTKEMEQATVPPGAGEALERG
ncbi:MAG: hypothetical protein V3W31_10035 [Thermodesulfobacteriota bacterium]